MDKYASQSVSAVCTVHRQEHARLISVHILKKKKGKNGHNNEYPIPLMSMFDL